MSDQYGLDDKKTNPSISTKLSSSSITSINKYHNNNNSHHNHNNLSVFEESRSTTIHNIEQEGELYEKIMEK